MKPTSSIFNRTFKLTFDKNKYMNLIAVPGNTQTHLGWVSPVDFRFGRIMMYFIVSSGMFLAYLDPAYLHETFGHFRQPPKYVAGLGSGLESEEKKLNLQIMKRHELEEKLAHFKHEISAFDGK